MDVSLASGRGHRIAEPSEARDGGVLDDLIDVRHLDSVVQVPSQERCGEQYLIFVETPHEHERTEIVAGQTDILETRAASRQTARSMLPVRKRRTRSVQTQFRHARRSGYVVMSSSTARGVFAEIQHPDTFYGRISSRLFPLAFPQFDDLDRVT